MATGSEASSEIYICNRGNGVLEFYRLDLDSLPEKLYMIKDFTQVSMGASWSIIDECIYMTGGIMQERSFLLKLSKDLLKYDTKTIDSTWETISSSKNLPWCEPFVFAAGRKLYVVGGDWFRNQPESPDEYPKHVGEFYDLDSKTWQFMPLKLEQLTKYGYDMYSYDITVKDKNEIIFYSFCGSMLFYDLAEDKLTCQSHPEFVSKSEWACGVPNPKGLEDCYYIDALFYIAATMNPVVRDSTLYWFSNDLRLYGYDLCEKRWFQSNRVGQLRWRLHLDRPNMLRVPLLLDLHNGTFLAMAPLDVKELGIAVLRVNKNEHSLEVSLQLSKTLPVDTSSHIYDMDGMVIMKNEGSMLGKRKFSMEV